MASVKSFKAGEPIFKSGDPGDAMYLIKNGQVEILVRGRLVELLAAGEFFGEMALIDHLPRSADAVAKTDCEIDVITDEQFLFRVQETPYFALKVMKVMAERLRLANARAAASA